ncbi:uncharacterized protein LOC124635023 isoform X4 [Helicoverpa zea]|uniref:uncharacterized protein LOC124635023 isoform X4 n=1 Tax=Helicoverpa zea TaxID=7113 RepID=UPI001F5A855C|nr:uncharacterized protein LOC124635023 isoform X4 [Helicoverpa zea]XP_047026725.1 uncharacterized protein LOC124635023 isoform X4 [Helicoverpa zea]
MLGKRVPRSLATPRRPPRITPPAREPIAGGDSNCALRHPTGGRHGDAGALEKGRRRRRRERRSSTWLHGPSRSTPLPIRNGSNESLQSKLTRYIAIYSSSRRVKNRRESSVGTWSKCRSPPSIQSGCVTASRLQEAKDPDKQPQEPGEDGDTSTEGLAQEKFLPYGNGSGPASQPQRHGGFPRHACYIGLRPTLRRGSRVTTCWSGA